MGRFGLLSVSLALVVAGAGFARGADSGTTTDASTYFESRVRPLLSNCYNCHGANNEQGGLRVDDWAAIVHGGASKKPAVVPGDPENSPLIQIFKKPAEPAKPKNPHHLKPDQLEVLVTWVTSGAYYPPPMPEMTPPKLGTAAKKFWSFVPPALPVVPEVASKEWSDNPIDRLVYAKMTANGLAPVGLADKRTLIRRATFDLTGLPPTPAETDAFVADNSPDAFAKVVDRLLASPHYGEEWGRHWLDIARYSDTAGESADYPIPQAYLYRNWVIDAFNRNQPYDQFIRDQIAGDLLPAANDAEHREKIIATGYIALSRRFSVKPESQMHLTIDDTIDSIGKGILGLSIGCARCHDHKFDPILAQDYYALYGFFASTRYPYPGSETKQHQDDMVPLSHMDDAKLTVQKDKLDAATLEVLRLRHLRDNATDPAEKQKLNDQLHQANLAKQRLAKQDSHVELAYAVADGDGHDARLLARGDPFNPQAEVRRAFLQVLGGQQLPSTTQGSGRAELAQWLTDAANPLTARVIVNRVWQYHFGKGIVQTPSDFGARGAAPTNPELLDWLTLQFEQDGWSIKRLTRSIMLSRVYQLSADDDAHAVEIDPGNDYLWHYRRHRLEAEAVRDAILADSGQLDYSPGGPHPFPPAADWHFTQHNAFSALYDSNRRSVYLMQQRIKKHPFFALFDGADTNVTTAQRGESATPLQALWLMNDPFVLAQSKALSDRLIRDKSDTSERVKEAYALVLGRPASPEELDAAQAYLREYAAKLAGTNAPAEKAVHDALTSLAQTLFSSNEFMFVE